MLARGSGPFVAASVAIAAVFVVLAYLWTNPLTLFLAALAMVLPFFVPYFFRDPERSIGGGAVSPADGKVMRVESEGGMLHIAIFMNVHDVHVNRAPLECTVASATRAGEGFKLAYEPDSDKNVRLEWVLDTVRGRVEVHQITGWFARRIVPYAKPGQKLAKGERFGMIRFGSRVDVWLPGGSYEPAVSIGQRVLAGSTTIARETGISGPSKNIGVRNLDASPAAGAGGSQ